MLLGKIGVRVLVLGGSAIGRFSYNSRAHVVYLQMATLDAKEEQRGAAHAELRGALDDCRFPWFADGKQRQHLDWTVFRSRTPRALHSSECVTDTPLATNSHSHQLGPYTSPLAAPE